MVVWEIWIGSRNRNNKQKLKSSVRVIIHKSKQVKYGCIEASELGEPAKIMTPKHSQ